MRSLKNYLGGVLLCAFAGAALAMPDSAVIAAAKAQKAGLLDTLKDLVSIDSGSADREGLDRISAYIAGRLAALGGKVEFIDAGATDAPHRAGRMVQAVFQGSGTKAILLIAHMDTVYGKGMAASQPFRVEGERAYGLGISDDKGGVALILHTMALLQSLNFRDYGKITVLINGDEEIGSPASRATLVRLGAAHELTLSHESSPRNPDQISLATAGIAALTLKVTGRASHAGAAPERGVNAVYELAHQLLQTRNLSEPATGVKMNWTMVDGGTNRNVIPAEATAEADIRFLRSADYEELQQKIRAAIEHQLIPDAKVEAKFARGRPPMAGSPAGLIAAHHAQTIYAEIGKSLKVNQTAGGGGTDAAYASSMTKNAVIEHFGLQGFGAHSNQAEYVLLDSIEPRLYLATRMIMDFSRGLVR